MGLEVGASPFVVLWYFFLVFLGIVVIVQLVFLLLASLVKWRVKVLMSLKPGKK